jgi:hypothetical protein
MFENPEMAMITFVVGFILWIIMFIITLKNEFKKPRHKVIWIAALLLFPPSALLFPFIGMKQLK